MASPCAESCYVCSYRNAQCFPDQRSFQREPQIDMSLETGWISPLKMVEYLIAAGLPRLLLDLRRKAALLSVCFDVTKARGTCWITCRASRLTNKMSKTWVRRKLSLTIMRSIRKMTEQALSWLDKTRFSSSYRITWNKTRSSRTNTEQKNITLKFRNHDIYKFQLRKKGICLLYTSPSPRD